MKQRLESISAWGKLWQVTFAPEKTQMMQITRQVNRHKPELTLNGVEMEESSTLDILGIKFDNKLTLKDHVKNLARKGAGKLAVLRRIAPLLDSKGCKILYESQVRPSFEYSPLSWMACPPSYLQLLDKLDHRARRMINTREGGIIPDKAPDSLQHRRDVAGLTVLHKANFQNNPWLSPLRAEVITPIHGTRGTTASEYTLKVPRSRTSLHQRSFLPHLTRLWNNFAAAIDVSLHRSAQSIKLAIHIWLSQDVVHI